MPKEKTSNTVKINHWLKSVDDGNIYKIANDARGLFCKACGKVFKCEKKSHLEQHERGDIHNKNVKKTFRQSLLYQQSTSGTANREFNLEMCNALIAANIPWNKLSCPKLKEFLQKYTGKHIPDESTLRKNYLEQCFQDTVERIKTYIRDNDIWISVDETTDSVGRYMANMIIGKLDCEAASVPILLSTKKFKKKFGQI
ncbi:uncharacterized protein LOC135143156 [Zophobas morio]|uniref:uncharacterized protein LOC135143156 n=1 Tax=Zophobas morio TaxID=2755281 RepID=UPI0030829E24